MNVNRARFLMLASTMATGGVLGIGCERAPYGDSRPAPSAVAPTPSAALGMALQPGPLLVDVLEPTGTSNGAAACDDSQGTPGECPSVGPSDEGGCANVISKRCNEFKAAMKPRVAAQAVACLNALKANDRCDPARINQCGHAALMTACPEPARPRKGQLTAATTTQPVSVVLTTESAPDPSPVAAACASIQRACGDRALAPTQLDCRQTLAGLNDTGRANMVACVSARCVSGGLYACEAVPPPAAAAASP
ncbi:MAG TPA: hypothetical protein VIW29_08265 [Polyangiaceae bacterium]